MIELGQYWMTPKNHLYRIVAIRDNQIKTEKRYGDNKWIRIISYYHHTLITDNGKLLTRNDLIKLKLKGLL